MNRNWLLALLVLALPTLAGERLRSIAWQDVDARGERVGAGELRVTGPGAGPRYFDIFTLDAPGVSKPVYALTGEVRYSDVGGEGYLQLLNDFGERGTYFTKGLAREGPLQKLSGSSAWRSFTLPFFATAPSGAILTPRRISFGVHLPAGGEVSLRGLALFQYDEGDSPVPFGGATGGVRPMAMAIAAAGILLGIWGAAVGVLLALGRGRLFSVVSTRAWMAIGVVCLLFAIWDLATGRTVSTLLLVSGAVLVIVPLLVLPRMTRRYAHIELRKMSAMDARRV